MEMGTFPYLTCFFLLSFFHATAGSFTPTTQSLCKENEKSALLQFKQSFFINATACSGSQLAASACPKVLSWVDGTDCCSSWDGVECGGGGETGHHVVGLDLSGSCLYGSIGSSSTLFRLIHLEKLNLAHNDFNHSQIPSALGRLSRLTHLDLSYSSFSGQIPKQVLKLSKLVSLDLEGNPSIVLLNPGLTSLVKSLTSLQELHLSGANISSTVPDLMANLARLKSLALEGCGLHGEFPREIFQLPNLQSLSLRYNLNLTGFLPEFHEGSHLQELRLASTSFHGKLPSSIAHLSSLNWLDISYCNFSGSVPSSMANLTQLAYLDLSANNFYMQTLPSWLGKLSQLTYLGLKWDNLEDEIPFSLANLTQLRNLSLRSNQFTGQLPHWLANLSHLTVLDVSHNKLQGPIPDSIFQLAHLEYLNVVGNNLSGAVEMDKFMKLTNLTHLSLSDNNLSVLTKISNASCRPWNWIGLGSCNLSKFPDFLRCQNELEWLNLEGNNLHEPIPKWIWNMSIETLVYLNFRANFLTGFMQRRFFLPWKRLEWISLAGNRLQGFPPIPPPSTYAYFVQNNSFTENLPPELCSLTLLYILDVSRNNLSGTIPPCFGSFSNNLVWLNLKGNNLHGTIPHTFKSGSQLRSIDLSQNKLRGGLPRSLANCAMLEILDISNNDINDNFPHWLGILEDLKVLILRSNRFHGIVGGVGNEKDFPKLHIIDLSYNDFCGSLPAEYFQNWKAIATLKRINSTYLVFSTISHGLKLSMMYSTIVTVKGVELPYPKIPDTFALIDLSSNNFGGAIPKSISGLKGLQLLNLSKNHFTGPILPSFGNLTELESLDLSCNNLSGQIPVELAKLTFLGHLNISYNFLSGVIPHGKQFDTFANTSYMGNLGLCGNPLSKKCENSESLLLPPTPQEKDTDTESGFEFDWIVMSMGYASGLVIGVVIGWTLATSKHEWFEETFGRKPYRH